MNRNKIFVIILSVLILGLTISVTISAHTLLPLNNPEYDFIYYIVKTVVLLAFALPIVLIIRTEKNYWSQFILLLLTFLLQLVPLMTRSLLTSGEVAWASASAFIFLIIYAILFYVLDNFRVKNNV